MVGNGRDIAITPANVVVLAVAVWCVGHMRCRKHLPLSIKSLYQRFTVAELEAIATPPPRQKRAISITGIYRSLDLRSHRIQNVGPPWVLQALCVLQQVTQHRALAVVAMLAAHTHASGQQLLLWQRESALAEEAA